MLPEPTYGNGDIKIWIGVCTARHTAAKTPNKTSAQSSRKRAERDPVCKHIIQPSGCYTPINFLLKAVC